MSWWINKLMPFVLLLAADHIAVSDSFSGSASRSVGLSANQSVSDAFSGSASRSLGLLASQLVTDSFSGSASRSVGQSASQ